MVVCHLFLGAAEIDARIDAALDAGAETVRDVAECSGLSAETIRAEVERRLLRGEQVRLRAGYFRRPIECASLSEGALAQILQ